MSRHSATSLSKDGFPKLTTTAVFGAAVYLAGQAFNLGFQLLLVRIFGSDTYGHIGLAHLLLTLLIFNADLGYGLYFLRMSPQEAGWRSRWRMANGHRLIAMAILIPGALLFWSSRYGLEDPGFWYLTAAAPGALLSYINFSSPLIVAGRPRTGMLLQQIVWPASFFILLAVHGVANPQSHVNVALIAGASVSMAFCFQAIANFSAINFDRGLISPTFGREGWPMLITAFNLALLGMVGSLHDRFTPFLIESRAHQFLLVYVILMQVLAGASGIINQFYRLLIANESNRNGRPGDLGSIISLITICATFIFIACTLLQEGGLLFQSRDNFRLASIVLLGWSTEVIGGLLAAAMIGRTQESSYFRPLMTGILLSTFLQLLAHELASLELILWGRVIGNLAILTLVFRVLQVGIPWPTYLLALIVLQLSFNLHSSAWLSVSVFGLLFIALVLFTFRRSKRTGPIGQYSKQNDGSPR